jgi:hypothetical protein
MFFAGFFADFDFVDFVFVDFVLDFFTGIGFPLKGEFERTRQRAAAFSAFRGVRSRTTSYACPGLGETAFLAAGGLS